jgi:hypothetical protein
VRARQALLSAQASYRHLGFLSLSRPILHLERRRVNPIG